MLMTAHAIGLSFNKTLEFFGKYGCTISSLRKMQWILENLLAFSLTGRRDEGFAQWNFHSNMIPIWMS